MPEHEFCDHCPRCRPALLNVSTGQPLADEDPLLVATNHVWDHETTFQQRQAFIRVTVHHSSVPVDRALCAQVMKLIRQALAEVP